MKTLGWILLSAMLAGAADAKHWSPEDLKLEILDVSADAKVELALDNVSSSPLRVWQGWNSWGYGRWRVLRLRNGELLTLSENLDQPFTRNFPAFDEVAGGGRVIVKLDLNEERWCENGFCLPVPPDRQKSEDSRISFKPGDTIIVVYDVPMSSDAFKLNVWYGVLANNVTKGQGG